MSFGLGKLHRTSYIVDVQRYALKINSKKSNVDVKEFRRDERVICGSTEHPLLNLKEAIINHFLLNSTRFT